MIRKIWDNVEEGALCLLLSLMVTITFVTVVTRYVFDFPLSYIDQLVPNMFVWVTFLGASAAVKRRAHLGLSLLYDLVPAGARAALDALILLGCGAFFLGTAVYGAKIVSMQMENRLMTSLGYPSWFVGLAVPVGSVLFVVRGVEAWARHRRSA
ncbi:MAG: TRAP transporter small permease [Deltaproteobacteria bacterium]|nr:MAG: TRAP transporter small permease [Deltaproteobacteria bacterium]